MQVLGEDVDPLGKLAQAHVGDVTRYGSLRAGVARGLELLDEGALGLDRLVAHDLANRVLPAVATLYHVAAPPPNCQTVAADETAT